MNASNLCSPTHFGMGSLRTAFMLAMSLWCAGSGAHALDLSAALARAKSHDPAFQAARFQRDALLEKIPQAQAVLRPSVHLRAGANTQGGRATFSDDPGVDRRANTSQWSVQLNQVLWNRSAQLGIHQADAQSRLAEVQFRLAEQELLMRVAHVYLEVGLAQENAGVIAAQVNAVCEQLALAEHNFDAGISTITDVHEARSRRDLVQAQKALAQAELEGKLAELERLLGEPVTALKRLDSGEEPVEIAVDMAVDWTEAAMQRSLQVHLQRAHAEIAEWELQRAKAAHGPTLELTASYGSNRSRGSVTTPMEITSRSNSAQVGLQFSMPLYSGGNLSSRMREAALLREKAAQDVEAARRSAVASTKVALSAIRHGKCQVAALGSAVKASRASLESNRIGYRIGTRINVDVLNAQQQLFAAERDLYRARMELVMSVLRLKVACGDLADEDLTAIDQLLVARGSGRRS